MQSAGKLLPPETHAVLSKAELGMKGRVIIIGDVHGCVKEMKELLDVANYEHGLDTVILVGDLGDKGPYPLEVGYSIMPSPSTSSHTLIACRAAQSHTGSSQWTQPLELCCDEFISAKDAFALTGL